jgi:hypothetical protein
MFTLLSTLIYCLFFLKGVWLTNPNDILMRLPLGKKILILTFISRQFRFNLF